MNYMMDNDPEGLLRATRKEFTADGMKVTKVAFAAYSNDLNVEARYEND